MNIQNELSLCYIKQRKSLDCVFVPLDLKKKKFDIVRKKQFVNSLETSRLTLRRLTLDDAEALFRTVGDPKVMEFWAPGEDQKIEQTVERIKTINEHWNINGFGDWAMIEKKQNRLIGFCGLHYIFGMKEVNVGYAIEKSRWRLGFGTEVVEIILDFGLNLLNLKDIIAVIDPCNGASLKLIKKCGLIYWKESSYMKRPRAVYKISGKL